MSVLLRELERAPALLNEVVNSQVEAEKRAQCAEDARHAAEAKIEAMQAEANVLTERIREMHSSSLASIGDDVEEATSEVTLQARVDALTARLEELQKTELAAEDAMCLAQLEVLFKRVKAPWLTREQMQALYIGQYAEVLEHFAGRVTVTCAQMRDWLREHAVGRQFWARLCQRSGLPVAPFNASLYEIEHVVNAAWRGPDHPFNFMILFASVNNSVEFRIGPSHLKMIALGRHNFEMVQRFALWHWRTKATTPRDLFVQLDKKCRLLNLLDGPRQTTLATFCGKRKVAEV